MILYWTKNLSHVLKIELYNNNLTKVQLQKPKKKVSFLTHQKVSLSQVAIVVDDLQEYDNEDAAPTPHHLDHY